MGLVERRATKAFQDGALPELEKRIAAAAAQPLAIEVDWTSLEAEGYGHLYAEAWPKVYFEPLIAALAAVAIDEMGREAIAAKLETVLIRNSGTRGNHFEGGVLTLDYDSVANLEDGAERTREIQTLLERNL
jgi:hypothetical protein